MTVSEDDLAEYIREKMQEPTTISEEDLSPPVCAQCGRELTGDVEVVLWDIPERDNKDVVWRYRFCSEDCKDEAIHSGPDERMPHGDGERLTAEEREQLR